MTADSEPQFDSFSIRDRRSADQTSPIEYVHGFLNQRFRILLIDGVRQILGVFVVLDHTQTLTLKDCIEVVEDHEREIGVALIPLAQVQNMELAV
jgi:hypothetical protein